MNTIEGIREAMPSALRASLRRRMADLPAVLVSNTNLTYYNNSNYTIDHFHYSNHTTINSSNISHHITNSTTGTTTSFSNSGTMLALLVVLGISFVALPFILLLCCHCNDRQQEILPTHTTTATSAAAQSTTTNTTQEQHVNTHLAMKVLSMDPADRQKVESELMISNFSLKLDDEDDSHHHSGGNDETRHKEGCIICLGPFHPGEEVAQSVNQECCHLFHTECIVDWLVIHPHCPQCRRDFFLVSNNDSNNVVPMTTTFESQDP